MTFNRILSISNLLIGIFILVLIFLSIYWGSVGYDAPYYLGIARDISNGKVVYKDINSIYAPLMMYINAVIFYLFNNVNYFAFLGFQYLIILLSAYYLYKIAIFKNLSKEKSLFVALLFYVSILLAESIYINLEVYVALFTVMSFYSLLNKKFLLAGILLALTVFSKQYAILNFIPFLLYIFSEDEKKYKNILWFALGAIIPVFCFFVYFVVIEKTTLIQLFTMLTGGQYREDSLGSKFDLLKFIKDSKYMIGILLPILFFWKMIKFSNKWNIIFVIGIIVNLIPLIFQSFPHYHILAYSYIFFFIIYNQQIFSKVFVMLNLIIVFIITGWVGHRLYQYRSDYSIQKQKSNYYLNIYPKNSEVFLDGRIRYLYLLNGYKNPLLKQRGYDYYPLPVSDSSLIKDIHYIKDNE